MGVVLFIFRAVRMLATFRSLALAFQLCAITLTRVRAELPGEGPSLHPPFLLSVIADSTNGSVDMIPFTCETVDNFELKDWVLYRNGVAEGTTDPCISPGRYSNGILTVSPECDGHYSCAAEYTNVMNGNGLVLSAPLTVYCKCLDLCLYYKYLQYSIMQKLNEDCDSFGFINSSACISYTHF